MSLELSVGLEVRSGGGAAISPSSITVLPGAPVGTFLAQLMTTVSGAVLTLDSGPAVKDGNNNLTSSAIAGADGTQQLLMVSATRVAAGDVPYLKVTQGIPILARAGPVLAPVNITPPRVDGVAQVDQDLTVSDGIWANGPTSFTRQWHADDADILGATGTTFKVTPAQLGKTISVTVVAHKAGADDVPANSNITSAVIAAGAIVAPGAVNLTAWSAAASGYLAWDDGSDGGSPILAYKVYEGLAPGFVPGANPTFMWYGRQAPRGGLTNGVTRYYRVAAVNAIGTGPLSNEVAITPAANLTGPLRLGAIQGFAAHPWSAPLHPEHTITATCVGTTLNVTAGGAALDVGTILYGVSTSKAPFDTRIVAPIAVDANGIGTWQISKVWPVGISQSIYCYRDTPKATTDDGTILTVDMTAQGLPQVLGTFANPGKKTVSLATTQSGVTKSSSFKVAITAKPAPATAADGLAAALKLMDVYNNRASVQTPVAPPTVTLGAQGGTAPIGNPVLKRFGGGSGTIGMGTAVNMIASSYRPTSSNVTIIDPVTKAPVAQGGQNNWNNSSSGVVERLTMTKSKLAICLATTTGAPQVKGYYSDDFGVTIHPITPRPIGAPGSTGNRWIVFDWGSNPPSGLRYVELVFSAGAYLAGVGASYDFEAGENAVSADWPHGGLKVGIWPDSYPFGQGPFDFSNGIARQAVERNGARDIYNFGLPGFRYSYPLGDIATAMDRIAGNYLGYNEITVQGLLHLAYLLWTINDGAMGDIARLRAAYVMTFLRARAYAPNTILVGCIGLHPPDDPPSVANVNAYTSAWAEVFDADHCAILVNGDTGKRRYLGVETNLDTPGPWVNAPGTPPSTALVGSSPLYPSAGVGLKSCAITGSILNGVLTVASIDTAGGRVEQDLTLKSTDPAHQNVTSGSVVVSQIDGTPSGPGRYQLHPPWTVDVALEAMTVTADTPHPNRLGAAVEGAELAAAPRYLAGQVITAMGGGPAPIVLADAAGNPFLDSAGHYIGEN